MKERVVTFGPGGGLVGVLTEPRRLRPNSAAVVMSNVGLNHRVGPYRIWVELSRRLAGHGIASFRFDVSGLGDSAPRTDPLNDIERSVLDLEDALAWLAENVLPRFILVSLCSGTDNAHRVAVRDARVSGAVSLDGYSYMTPRALVHKHVGRWVAPKHWRRWLRRRFPSLFGLERDRRAVGAVDEIYTREYPSRLQFERDIARIVDRGARLLFVFSGETSYLYRGQFWDWLERKDWGGGVAVEYYPKADHTFMFQAEREAMLSRVTEWIQHAIAAASARAEANPASRSPRLDVPRSGAPAEVDFDRRETFSR
jgi:hypothetical protein